MLFLCLELHIEVEKASTQGFFTLHAATNGTQEEDIHRY